MKVGIVPHKDTSIQAIKEQGNKPNNQIEQPNETSSKVDKIEQSQDAQSTSMIYNQNYINGTNAKMLNYQIGLSQSALKYLRNIDEDIQSLATLGTKLRDAGDDMTKSDEIKEQISTLKTNIQHKLESSTFNGKQVFNTSLKDDTGATLFGRFDISDMPSSVEGIANVSSRYAKQLQDVKGAMETLKEKLEDRALSTANRENLNVLNKDLLYAKQDDFKNAHSNITANRIKELLA